MVAAAFVYAKGFERGSGVAAGMRFDMLLGAFAAGYAAIVGYALTNFDHFQGFHLIQANFVEWTINGVVIGLLYQPSTARQNQPAPQPTGAAASCTCGLAQLMILLRRVIRESDRAVSHAVIDTRSNRPITAIQLGDAPQMLVTRPDSPRRRRTSLALAAGDRR